MDEFSCGEMSGEQNFYVTGDGALCVWDDLDHALQSRVEAMRLLIQTPWL